MLVEAEQRAIELVTIPALIEDIESDLSVFHRIDDIDQLSARRFFSLVQRLPVYGGVLAASLTHHRPDLAPEAAPADLSVPMPAVDLTPGRADAALGMELYGALPGLPPVFSHSYAPLAESEG